MKKYLLIIYFIFSSSFVFAQSKQIDSLLNLLKTNKEDTNKVIHINILTEEFISISKYDTALFYCKEALKSSQKIGYKTGTARVYNLIGEINWRQGEYPEALKNHFMALKIAEDIKDKKSIADSYSNIGTVYVNQHNYSEALKNYRASLKLFEETKNMHGMAISYNNIGIICDELRNYPEALKNYFAALKVFEKNKDKYSIAAAYGNIALIYDQQGNYNEAIKNYIASIKINEEIGSINNMIDPLVNLGELYIPLNKPKEARSYLNRALQLSKKIKDKGSIVSSYGCLALLDSAIGNYKEAFEYQKLTAIYNDSIYNEENAKQITELSAKYESEKKEKEIAVLKVEQTITQAQHQRKQLVYASIIILITIMAFFILNRQRLKSKKNKIIFEKQEALLQAEKQKAEDELLYAKNLLINYTDNLIEKNRAIEELQYENEKLKGLKAAELYKEKINNLDDLNNATILTNEDWEKFKELFEQVYKGFFTRLKDKLPNLTNAETRLVSLIKLNLDAKQMANMLGVSPNTITVTKYRLRKKLNLNEKQDIDSLVESI